MKRNINASETAEILVARFSHLTDHCGLIQVEWLLDLLDSTVVDGEVHWGERIVRLRGPHRDLHKYWLIPGCVTNKRVPGRIFVRYQKRQKIGGSIITINAPLILKMRDIIFFLRANYIKGHFKGYFEGAKIFLTPKLSRAQRGAILRSKKSRPPRNIPRNGPLCSLPKTKKK